MKMEALPTNARLGRGLVFDDEIAAQQERRSDAHPTPFRKQRRVRDSRQFRGSGSLSRAGQEGRTERMREPDKGSKERKGARGAGRPRRIKEDGVPTLSPHQIVDFTPAPAPAPARPVLSRSFPTHPLH